jgi:FkbM family methyltransferase
MSAAAVLRNIWAIARTGRAPSRRALAALAKLHGRRLTRRWPFLPRSAAGDLNLNFDDLLELQHARSRSSWVVVVGAYDGVENDPLADFIRKHACRGILLEPQPASYARLCENMGSLAGLELVNAAVAQVSGALTFFYVPAGIEGLPHWVTQLASFSREHIVRHEDRAPGVSRHIASLTVDALSFDDLLDRYQLPAIDVLQIDAEGMDALLLGWFPFERIRPDLIHYEISHLGAVDLERARARLRGFGYTLFPTESQLDEIAVMI